MMRWPGRRNCVYAFAGALAGFFIAWAMLYEPPAPMSFAQCVLAQMKGRPEGLLAFGITVCKERQQASTNPIDWGALPATAAK